MHTIESKYIGDLRTENLHVRSGQKIITDAPIDNSGKGEAFSPTDLVATAVTDCILTIAGQAANSHGFSIQGAKAKTTKIMSQYAPRRIAEIYAEIDFSTCNLNEKQIRIIKIIPESCPVALSLHPDVKQNINFIF
jgi:putative redox protein